MARPDQGRRVCRRVPLLLATLAVVVAATAVYLTRPASAAQGRSAYGAAQPAAAPDQLPPAAKSAAPPVLPPDQPKPLPPAAAPAAPPPPPKKEKDAPWDPKNVEWYLTPYSPPKGLTPRPPLGGPYGPISAPKNAPVVPERVIRWDGNEHDPFPMPPEMRNVDLMKQTQPEADAKSAACVNCHRGVGDMHDKNTVHLGCVDCHGSNGHLDFPPVKPGDYCPAAPPSRNPHVFATSANPVRSYTVLNHENADFIRFVNPADFRVAHISCGTTNCHPKEVMQNHKSMMTHGCMLWGAALYNNGGVPNKRARFGEAYGMRGEPLRLQTIPPPSEWEMKHRGVIPFLDPLIRFEVSQPGNVLRIFERGGKFRGQVGIPEQDEAPGRPILSRLSNRGLGTQNRTDPVFVGLQKTRLFDPTTNFIGTNDHAGDFRQSGCASCHVIYANDRSPVNSGPYAKYGSRGLGYDKDPMIRKDEPGHPIAHRFAKGSSIPTSQCMICHVHPGTTVMNSYIGYMWWDVESDAKLMYPKEGKHLSAQQVIAGAMSDPNEISLRGNWSDPEFLATLYDKNPETEHNYFGDFHSHGWVFRAVFRQDKKGNMLDYYGDKLKDFNAASRIAGMNIPVEIKELYHNYNKKTPAQRVAEEKKVAMKRHGVAHHLLDIHMEKGMHCVDCHFVQDNHGNTRLQMEVRAAVEIQCIDCHGTVTKEASLRTSGPAAYTSTPGKPWMGRDLAAMRTPSGKPRFERKGGRIYQNSMVEKDLTWEVVQTKDTINPASEHYNTKAALAKTVHREGDKLVWGKVPPPTTPGVGDSGCAHSNKNMTCQSCHSSWNPSCYGCHLPQRANIKMPQLHNEGDVTRNYTAYNWQTLRDEVFMLARDGDATG
ncbi:MAG TPA: cytochrome c3 family protein, partial [Gemmataceae bacterium]|nr:cytochrome c3 family protein [Gemmataceae bacterium]